jgi:cell shape-determining protein MreC
VYKTHNVSRPRFASSKPVHKQGHIPTTTITTNITTIATTTAIGTANATAHMGLMKEMLNDIESKIGELGVEIEELEIARTKLKAKPKTKEIEKDLKSKNKKLKRLVKERKGQSDKKQQLIGV